MVQLFPTAGPLPQLFCSRKSPLTLMLEILILALPAVVTAPFLLIGAQSASEAFLT